MPLQLPWLEPGSPFPPIEQAWGPDSEAPGLLAAGGDLTVGTLQEAYGQAIFPWFSLDQPILWWSTDPRMVLQVADFRLHRSLLKTLKRFRSNPQCEIRVDTAFDAVIRACAGTRRSGQTGTWIVAPMVAAYRRMHAAGLAHSVEVWVGGELTGGLYCVALGRAVFGESMFSLRSDASKIALAALVALCRQHHVTQIDCQQQTAHLASLGAAPVPRSSFLRHVAQARSQPTLQWQFSPLYWDHILSA